MFELESWLEWQPGKRFQIAATTVAELWRGIERATPAYKAERELHLRTILSSIRILPYTEVTALEHARLWAELQSTGNMVGY